MIQKELLCVIQFQFIYVHLSIYYNIQSIIVMQPKTDSQSGASTLPDHVIFVLKKFLKPKSIKNLPIPTPT
jgi:hypothetical protein